MRSCNNWRKLHYLAGDKGNMDMNNDNLRAERRPDVPIRIIMGGAIVEARFRGADLDNKTWIFTNREGDERILWYGTDRRIVRTSADSQAVTATLKKIQRLTDELRAANELLDQQTRVVDVIMPVPWLVQMGLQPVEVGEENAVKILRHGLEDGESPRNPLFAKILRTMEESPRIHPLFAKILADAQNKLDGEVQS